MTGNAGCHNYIKEHAQQGEEPEFVATQVLNNQR